MKYLPIKICLLILSFVLPTDAKDFGRRGQVFSIAEEGFVKMIECRLQAVDIAKMQTEMQTEVQEKIKARIKRPQGQNLPRTVKARSFLYDPTFTLEEDVKLPDGKIFYHKGWQVNPLDSKPLDKKLVFIDGDDQPQVSWLAQQLGAQKLTSADKIILVKGAPLALSDRLQQPVYFDQFALLTKKFGIKQVPAVISAQSDGQNNLIKVDECEL